MKSLALGELFGIKLELHWSFLLIGFTVILLLALTQPANLASMLMVFFFLFLSVFLHELTHSVVSMQRGIKVERIVLLPIGGVAMTESLPEKAKDEFLIAVSGPLLNFLVVITILISVSVLPVPFPRELLADFGQLFYSAELVIPPLLSMPLFTILWWNLILGAFNLFLPALPLDGGRVFRSLVSFKLGYVKATILATKIASIIAVALFFLYFLTYNIFLPIIAFFIFFGSREEEKLVLMKDALKNIRLLRLLNKKPFLLKGSITIEEAFNKMLRRKKSIALVEIDEDKYAELSIEELPKLSEKKGTALSKVLRKVKPLPSNASPSRALERMLSTGNRILPVIKGKKLIGVIEARELERAYIMARARSLLKK